MKLAISYLYDSDFDGVAEFTRPPAVAYAKRHGYELYVQRYAVPFPYARNIQWHRVNVIEELLFRRDFEIVLHLDADALITNPEIKIEDLIIPNADLMMAREPGGAWNDGISIWMNTEWMRRGLQRIWDAEAPDATSANGVIQKWADEKGAYGSGNFPFILREIPKRKINSYPPEWQAGDFILHTPGHSNEARIRIFNRVLNPTDPLTGEWWKEGE